MKLKRGSFLILSLFLFLPSVVFSSPENRDAAIIEALINAREEQYKRQTSSSPFSERKTVIDKTLSEIEFELAVNMGYMGGSTTYDFDNHTSELMFPLDNFVVGLDARLKKNNLSLNGEVWGSIDEEAGTKSTDKDWDSSGTLTSHSESSAFVNAVIWDANLRYDFYNNIMSRDNDLLILKVNDKITVGGLVGYRYERFDFDLYDLYYPSPPYATALMTYEGEIIGTYQIKYWLPYLGFALDVLRENSGIKLQAKYSFQPKAEDLDNHLLRELTFYGDYDDPVYAYMFNVKGFWEFAENWSLNLGADGTFVKIDGTTWEEDRDPAWDKDQFTELVQWIFWSGLSYKF